MDLWALQMVSYLLDQSLSPKVVLLHLILWKRYWTLLYCSFYSCWFALFLCKWGAYCIFIVNLGCVVSNILNISDKLQLLPFIYPFSILLFLSQLWTFLFDTLYTYNLFFYVLGTRVVQGREASPIPHGAVNIPQDKLAKYAGKSNIVSGFFII